jgi:hypothetical protein
MGTLLSKAPDVAHRALLNQMVDNPVDFVRANFSLTKQQDKDAGKLTPAEINALRQGAQTALRETLAVKADCGDGQKFRPLDPGEQVIAKAGNFSITKVSAAPGGVTARNGFSGTVMIHMLGQAGNG